MSLPKRWNVIERQNQLPGRTSGLQGPESRRSARSTAFSRSADFPGILPLSVTGRKPLLSLFLRHFLSAWDFATAKLADQLRSGKGEE
jgi:hypothetical protein